MSAKSSKSSSPSKGDPVLTLSADDAAKRTKSDKAKYYASIASTVYYIRKCHPYHRFVLLVWPVDTHGM